VTQIAHPFHFDGRGRTAATGEAEHVRDLVEQVLFTAPGERVNRPDFGCGLLELVFEPAGAELATATQFLVQSALQRWLGDLIALDAVEVEADQSTLRVNVAYTVRATGQRRTERFERAT
jgi:Bacteriophage baseplate protein W